ncbi:Protein CBG12468 [Caenorhabditis briggsae]|uniref:Protein CBG12468 n=3 Tax=Caenorhabditis briggsae TaxID=6238 RepID=A8XFI3_CAEBR|nr:Protein CBG12468 [Caenorhabditis briggsae]ULT97579.1 hypothetical protein L3Y34_005417 [Caenorhabditis briggsae]CAP31444.1 Protein CBG12468 [Caenorhabditis briggsae]
MTQRRNPHILPRRSYNHKPPAGNSNNNNSMQPNFQIAAAPPKPKNQKKRQQRVPDEIRKLQASTQLIFPKSRFRKIVKELLQDYLTPLQVADEAVDALQFAAEGYLVKLFKQTNKLTIRSGRKTIKKEDLQLVLDLLGGEND